MASEQGLGKCRIPTERGLCSKQIAQGEPIGTVIVHGKPMVGHRDCAAEYQCRESQRKYIEAAERDEMAKRVSQQGIGGAVDYSQAQDMVSEGSYPIPEYKNKIAEEDAEASRKATFALPDPPPVVDPPKYTTMRKEIDALLEVPVLWGDPDFLNYMIKCLATYDAWEARK